MVDEDTSGQNPTQSFRVPTEDQKLYSSREMRVSPAVSSILGIVGLLPRLGLTLGSITLILPDPKSLGCSALLWYGFISV